MCQQEQTDRQSPAQEQASLEQASPARQALQTGLPRRRRALLPAAAWQDARAAQQTDQLPRVRVMSPLAVLVSPVQEWRCLAAPPQKDPQQRALVTESEFAKERDEVLTVERHVDNRGRGGERGKNESARGGVAGGGQGAEVGETTSTASENKALSGDMKCEFGRTVVQPVQDRGPVGVEGAEVEIDIDGRGRGEGKHLRIGGMRHRSGVALHAKEWILGVEAEFAIDGLAERRSVEAHAGVLAKHAQRFAHESGSDAVSALVGMDEHH